MRPILHDQTARPRDSERRLAAAQVVAAAALPLVSELTVKSVLDPLPGVEPRELLITAGFVLAIGLGAARLKRQAQRLAVAFGLGSLPVITTLVLEALLGANAGVRDVLRSGPIALLLGSILATLLAVGAARVSERRAFRAASLPLVVLVGSFGLLLPFLRSDRASREPGSPPDVVLMILDTARADHLSVYGYHRRTTPSLEQLSLEARVYERAWSPSPWTPPAHASIFTGLLPAAHDVEGGPLDAPAPTLAEALRDNGYATLGVVNNPLLVDSKGWSRGFDTYLQVWDRPGFSLGYLAWSLRFLHQGWYFSGDAAASLRWVRRWWRLKRSLPKLVMINFIDPHSPYGWESRGSQAFLDRGTRRAADLSHKSEDYDAGLLRAEGIGLERMIALYDSDLLHLDRHIGKLVEWLRRLRDLDETIIVVTADHGERLGERGLLGHQLGLDESLLRVPLIVRYPPSVAAGRSAAPVQTHGIFATILELAGIDPPPSALQRAQSLDRQRNPVVVAQTRHQGWYLEILADYSPSFDPAPFDGHWSSVSDGVWKLVRSTSGATRLYFLPDDPEEAEDLAPENPEIVARLLAWLEALPKYGEGPDSLEFPEETRELLESLGYVN